MKFEYGLLAVGYNGKSWELTVGYNGKSWELSLFSSVRMVGFLVGLRIVVSIN